MEAAGISYADLLTCQGLHPERRRAPFVPGWDVVGVVESVGSEVDQVRVGDRVAALTIVGGWAEYAVVPGRWVVPVPDGLPQTPATGVMDRLFAGPTPAEQARGLQFLASGATGFSDLSLSQQIARVRLAGGCSSGGPTVSIAGEIFPLLLVRHGGRRQGLRPAGPDRATHRSGGLHPGVPGAVTPAQPERPGCDRGMQGPPPQRAGRSTSASSIATTGDALMVVDEVTTAVEHQLAAVELDRPRMVRGVPVHQVDPGVDEPTGEADVSPWHVVPSVDRHAPCSRRPGASATRQRTPAQRCRSRA
ncbi:Alcohol dehydrogenase GroES-like domain-containing protein [Geodermatophilus obscurus]|uniref:Alcohol dehydrogenase GroES-like domain-containing protein n=1 Tax=Geodermatophilus obscurus TaxID=1861 RepID=A0A1M7UXU4_9ACTN|nr:Alcohol dehydrogenase GroES-like domain-containing protein [Geodermatophilus obscurus]